MPVPKQIADPIKAEITNNVSTITDVNLDKSGLATDTNQAELNGRIGATNESAAASDTATSGLNGLVKRLLQRVTALLPSNLGAKTAANSFAVTLATDGAGVTTLTSIDNKTPALGQKTSAGSTPVVLPSDQIVNASLSSLPGFAVTPTFNIGTISTIATESTLSNINGKLPANLTVSNGRLLVDGSGVNQPVTQFGNWDLRNITGTISLPTNAATEAKQDTGNTSLSSIDNKLPNGLTVASNRLQIATELSQPLTQSQLLAQDVPTIVNADQSVLLSELLYYIQSRNLLNGKQAWGFTILGNRTSFVNTTAFHDICEFLTTTDLVYTQVTTASNLEIVSSSANDTAAGTGTRSVKITYLDNAGILTESPAITLNGTTPVSAGFTASAILWMESASGGSSQTSAGNIVLRNVATPTLIYEQITAGGNKSLSGRFTVPSNCTAYLVDYDFAAISQTMDVRLRATVDSLTRLNNGDRFLFQVRKFLASGQNIAQNGRYLRFGAGTQIKASAIPGATGGSPRCDVNFTLLVVEN